MKPAVGFTLPSAGVIPAPSINRKMARTPFCSQVLWEAAWGITSPQLGCCVPRNLLFAPWARVRGSFTGEAAGRIAAGR